MFLRFTSLRSLLLCLACCLSTASVEAGVIPWTYNAIFGTGPMYSGWGGWGAPYGGGYAGYGYGWGGGYPMAGYYGGYAAPSYGVAYGPSLSYGYGAYPAVSNCSSCATATVNYAPACGSDCGLCNSGCGSECNAGCGNCSSGTSTYSPEPDSNSNVQPTPAGTPSTPPKDDFGPTQNRNNDNTDDVGPSTGTDARGFELPARAPANFGEDSVFPSDSVAPASGGSASPSGGTIAPMEDDITPSGGSTITPEANPFINRFEPERIEPLDIEPAVATTTMPIRRRTSFTTRYRVPTAVRVAVTPAPRHPAAPQVATK